MVYLLLRPECLEAESFALCLWLHVRMEVKASQTYRTGTIV